MKADGSKVRRVTFNKENDFGPASWSPDDKQLIFLSHQDKPEDHLEISIVNSDGTKRRKLTSRNLGEEDKSWSKDGKQILFAGETNKSWQIFLINTDGTGLKQLANGSAHHYRPSFSPDNKKIAYTVVDDEKWDLWIMDRDGKNPKLLVGKSEAGHNKEGEEEDDHEDKQSGSHFSPNGKKILYSETSSHKNDWKIFVMNVDGSSKKQLTFGKSTDWYLSWFPSNLN